ncbi:unnamed protein product [Absidia cylindrospora]
MNAYVSKPVRKEELEAAIHTYTQTLAVLSPQNSPTELSVIVELQDIEAIHPQQTEDNDHIDMSPLVLPTVTITEDMNEYDKQ